MTYFKRLLLHNAMREGKLHSLEGILRYVGDETLQSYQFAHQNQTPLYMACATGDVRFVEFALKRGSNLEEAFSGDLQKCVHVASELGFVEIVKYLLDHGVDVNSHAGLEKLTSLHVAALCGHKDVVRVLMEQGADHTDNRGGSSPLHMACIGGHHEIVEILVDAGSDVNEYNSEGLAPLHLAAELGYPWVISVLLGAGALINALSENGEYISHREIPTRVSPLYLAADNRQLEAVIILLKSGAEMKVSPHHADVITDDPAMFQLLLEHGVDFSSGKDDYLPNACREGHNEMVKLLVDAGANVNFQSESSGKTPLHIAAKRGNSWLIRFLLEAGALINALTVEEYEIDINREISTVSYSRMSPLHYAVTGLKYEAATILLESGAKPDIPECKVSPLHAVCLISEYKMAELLLDHGADIDAQYPNAEETPLVIVTSLSEYDVGVIELLLARGANVNLPDMFGETPLGNALVRGDHYVVELILEHGGELSVDDEKVMLEDDRLKMIVKKHFIKMKTAKLCSPSKNWKKVEQSLTEPDLEGYQQMCCQEITSMKTKHIGRTGVTHYDLLKKGAAVCRNQEVVEALEQSGDFKIVHPFYRRQLTVYPIYGRQLALSYKEGLERRESLDKGYPAFAYLMEVNLPIVALDELFSYLSNQDLLNLAALYHTKKELRKKAGTSREQLTGTERAKKRIFTATEDDDADGSPFKIHWQN